MRRSRIEIMFGTAFAQDSLRGEVDDALRACRVTGVVDIVDAAAVCESAVNGRYAIADGGQAITADGLHLNAVGCQVVQRSELVRAVGERLLTGV